MGVWEIELGRKLEDEVDVSEFPEFLRQRFSDEIARVLTRVLQQNFKGAGYTVSSDSKHTFKNKTGWPDPSHTLKDNVVHLEKGTVYGTSARLYWRKGDLDYLQVEVMESSEQLSRFQGFCAFLTIILFYALTIIYNGYWLVALIMAFVCFLLVVVVAIAPAIIGFYLGALIGTGLYRCFVRGEVKETNEDQRKYTMLTIQTLANGLTEHYRKNMESLVKTPYPLTLSPMETPSGKEDGSEWWLHLHLPH
ncbi:MAG: hypothetical protein V1934_04345 [Methanobacteriota archaeon]